MELTLRGEALKAALRKALSQVGNPPHQHGGPEEIESCAECRKWDAAFAEAVLEELPEGQ